MVSKSITKLIDEAIIPAMAIVVAKMIGLLFASYFFNLPFTIENRQIFYILPSVHFRNIQDYIVAENYANLAMFVIVAAGTILVLIKAHFLHASHIHPNLHARLVTLNLESLIAPSYHLYHQAAIWLIFLWLTVGFLAISTLLGITYPQISIIAFVIAANFSWIFAIDIEKEVEISRNTNEA